MFRSENYSIILAAGESRRMGFPKPMMRLGDKTFLERIIEIHSDLALLTVIVLGSFADEISKQVSIPASTRILTNPRPQDGPLSSILIALESIPDARSVLIHPVDHPLVQGETLETLLESSRSAPGCILQPVFQGRKGHPLLYPYKFLADLKSAPLSVGARWVTRHNRGSVLRIPVEDPGIHLNIDTPRQYKEITQRIHLFRPPWQRQ